jgi:hypothetical protein
MTRPAVRAVRAPALALAATLLGGALATTLGACGASPMAVGPTGIDGLTIPTPSPDQADFAARVDNPWFPLVPGTVWVYKSFSATQSGRVVATVLRTPREIAGVATTGVRWQTPQHGRSVTIVVRWYAEDTAGNVWWFGQDVRRPSLMVDPLAGRSWLAGQGGVEAGLLLSAQPRVGDGYVNAQGPGVERRSTVVSLTATVATPGRIYRDTVLTRDVSSLVPTEATQTFFARGVGIAATETMGVTASDLSLMRKRGP